MWVALLREMFEKMLVAKDGEIHHLAELAQRGHPRN